jgi:hypothetical protein
MKTLCKNCQAINPAQAPKCHNCGERIAKGLLDAASGSLLPAMAGPSPRTCSRSFLVQVREITSPLGKKKTLYRALDTETGELITTANTRRCAESVAVELYGYAPVLSENKKLSD